MASMTKRPRSPQGQCATKQLLAGRRNMVRLETMDLDGLGVEAQTFLLVDEEFLNVLSLVSLELNDLAHLGIVHDSAIAGCDQSARGYVLCEMVCRDSPNFFLITLRIFFWSNFFGRPWTVVRVLRPLRSAKLMLVMYR